MLFGLIRSKINLYLVNSKCKILYMCWPTLIYNKHYNKSVDVIGSVLRIR